MSPPTQPDSGARVPATTEIEDAAAGGIDGAVTTPPPAPTCPVCMEPWNCTGDHRICCIPCGHVYGRSCLERWLHRSGNDSAKCPQCGEQFELDLMINLYAPGNLWDGCCRLQEAKAHFQLKIREVMADSVSMVAEESARSKSMFDELRAELLEKKAELDKKCAENADNMMAKTEFLRAGMLQMLDQMKRLWDDQEATAKAELMTMKETMKKMAEEEKATAADLMEFMELSYPRLSQFSKLHTSLSASALVESRNTMRHWNAPDELPTATVPALPGYADAFKKRRRQGT